MVSHPLTQILSAAPSGQRGRRGWGRGERREDGGAAGCAAGVRTAYSRFPAPHGRRPRVGVRRARRGSPLTAASATRRGGAGSPRRPTRRLRLSAGVAATPGAGRHRPGKARGHPLARAPSPAGRWGATGTPPREGPGPGGRRPARPPEGAPTARAPSPPASRRPPPRSPSPGCAASRRRHAGSRPGLGSACATGTANPLPRPHRASHLARDPQGVRCGARASGPPRFPPVSAAADRRGLTCCEQTCAGCSRSRGEALPGARRLSSQSRRSGPGGGPAGAGGGRRAAPMARRWARRGRSRRRSRGASASALLPASAAGRGGLWARPASASPPRGPPPGPRPARSGRAVLGRQTPQVEAGRPVFLTPFPARLRVLPSSAFLSLSRARAARALPPFSVGLGEGWEREAPTRLAGPLGLPSGRPGAPAGPQQAQRGPCPRQGCRHSCG